MYTVTVDQFVNLPFPEWYYAEFQGSAPASAWDQHTGKLAPPFSSFQLFDSSPFSRYCLVSAVGSSPFSRYCLLSAVDLSAEGCLCFLAPLLLMHIPDVVCLNVPSYHLIMRGGV